MKIVDILRDQHEVAPCPLDRGLQLGQRKVRRVGLGVAQGAAAGVVEIMHETRIAHEAFRRRDIFKGVLRPDSALVAKGAHAAFSGHACAGKDDDSPEGHDASPLRHTYRLRGSQLYRP